MHAADITGTVRHAVLAPTSTMRGLERGGELINYLMIYFEKHHNYITLFSLSLKRKV